MHLIFCIKQDSKCLLSQLHELIVYHNDWLHKLNATIWTGETYVVIDHVVNTCVSVHIEMGLHLEFNWHA